MTKFKNIAVAAVLLVIFSNITYAQSEKTAYPVNASANAEEPLKVTYIGDDGEYLVFQVTFHSNDTKKGRFGIEDKNEGQIYSSVLSTNFKVETIKIEKTEADQVLNFKLVIGKKTFSKSFSVNTSLVETTTVAEREITKL